MPDIFLNDAGSTAVMDGTVAHDTPTRLLARSLLQEALCGHVPASTGRAIPRRSGPRQTWTRAAILAAMVVFRRQTGAWPTGTDWRHGNAFGLPSRQTMGRFFRSIDAATAAAQHLLGETP